MPANLDMSEEKADETPAPEAPSPPEQGDGDEFARLPPPRPRRSPIVSLAVIAVGGLLLFHLVDDTRFALAPKAPRDLGEARALNLGTVEDNSFVAVRGIPDRRNALLFEPKGDSYRRAFYRLLGTDSRLFVRAEQTSTRHTLDDRYEGRLRRFEKISWGAQIRDYYAKKVEVTRFLDLDPLRARLAAGGSEWQLTDRAGDPVSLTANTDVNLSVDYPEDLKVSLSKKQFAVEEDARHEIERLGLPVGPGVTDRDGYVYVLRIDPKKRDALLTQLDEHGFPFAARRERLVARLGELAAAGPDGLSIPLRKENPSDYNVVGSALQAAPAADGKVVIPWARVASIQVEAPIAIPEGAWLVSEGESPSDYSWVLALDGLLVVFILFNIFILVRSRRAAAPDPAPAK
jgi:hypothetical protein